MTCQKMACLDCCLHLAPDKVAEDRWMDMFDMFQTQLCSKPFFSTLCLTGLTKPFKCLLSHLQYLYCIYSP